MGCEGAGCGAWLHPASPSGKSGATPDSARPMRSRARRCQASHALPGAGSVPGSLPVHAASPACVLSSVTSCLPCCSLPRGAGAGGPPVTPLPPRNPSASPQVLSGCAIIVRGQPRGGPPPERQINLSNIRAGNLARRAAAGQPDAKDTPDEVGASRERCRAAPLPPGPWAELDGVPPGCWPSPADPSTLGSAVARGVARSQTWCCHPLGRGQLPPCPARGHAAG